MELLVVLNSRLQKIFNEQGYDAFVEERRAIAKSYPNRGTILAIKNIPEGKWMAIDLSIPDVTVSNPSRVAALQFSTQIIDNILNS